MRVSDGSVRTYPDGGSLHILRESDRWHGLYIRTVRITPPATPPVNMQALMQQCIRNITHGQLMWLGDNLHVGIESLKRFGVGYSYEHRAFTFSMHLADGSVSGIRLRRPDGQKFSVRGGHEGIFYASDWYPREGETIFIVEGASDAIALHSIGIKSVIGRPSCSGGVGIITDLVREHRPSQCVIIADADKPGQRGAETLCHELMLLCSDCRLIKPPDGIKDARAWVIAGADENTIQQAASTSPIKQYTIRGVLHHG
jgi:hypothetical protein